MIITNDLIKEATIQPQSNLGNMLALDPGDKRCSPGWGTWYDLSGNGNNVTLYNSPTFTNNYFTFNGTTQYGQAYHSDSLSVKGNSMTIEYWIYWNADDAAIIVSKAPYTGGPNSQNGNYMTIQYFENGGNQNLYFLSNDGSDNTNNFNGENISSRTNAWFQYVVVMNNLNFKFFRNGTLYTTAGSGPNSLNPTTEDLLIGKRKDDYGMLNGRLSIVNLYDYALTDNQVKDNFNFYRTRFGI